MNTAEAEKTLTTADLAAASEKPAQDQVVRTERETMESSRPSNMAEEPLAALFTPDIAGDFRSRWDNVQIGFVDDPRAAVQKADELVAQVMKNLAETFSSERSRFEEQLNNTEGGASTENLRVALQRYRSFFQRLLSL
jgi:hypothetical protein